MDQSQRCFIVFTAVCFTGYRFICYYVVNVTLTLEFCFMSMWPSPEVGGDSCRDKALTGIATVQTSVRRLMSLKRIVLYTFANLILL